MRALSSWLLQFVMAATLAAAHQQASAVSSAATYAIRGTLVERGSGQPIARARVSIQVVTQPQIWFACVTRADGSFEFKNLAPGKYRLTAELHDVSRMYQEHDQFSTAIVTGPELDSEHIVFAWPQPAKLQVAVLDEEGEPARAIQLLLFRTSVQNGWHRTWLREQAVTNSEGVHRFTHLQPGTYYVAAQGRPWYVQNSPIIEFSPAAPVHEQAKSELDVAYPITYYGGATDAEEASPIQLQESQKAEIQIHLTPVPAVTVELSGPETSGKSPSRPSSALQVNGLWQKGPGSSWTLVPPYVFTGPNGRRALAGLAPGAYRISLEQMKAASSSSGSAVIQLNADAKLDLSGLKQTNVSGNVSFENGVPPGSVSVGLINIASGMSVFGAVGMNGAFSVDLSRGFSPGRYEVRLVNAPGVFMRAARVRGAVYADGLLDIADGANISMSIVAGTGLVRLSGIALRDGRPCSGAMVLAVPNDLSRGRFIARDQSDSDGTFALDGLAPGRYTVFAIDDGTNLAYQDVSVIRPYLAHGVALEISGATPPALSLSVMPRLR